MQTNINSKNIEFFSRSENNLSAAIELAHAGIAVFPAKIFYEEQSDSWKKRPHIEDWQTKATTDQETISDWWKQFPDAVPAIALGVSNLVVIDVDRHGKADGISNFEKLIEGHQLPICPITKTAGGGKHYIFRQPNEADPLGNGKGSLPAAIDVRGSRGFIIAPNAIRPDDRIYETAESAPSLVDAFRENSVPVLPEFLEAILQTKRSLPIAKRDATENQRQIATSREKAYALAALKECVQELENAERGTRNTVLNNVSYRMGRIAKAGWIDDKSVRDQLSLAAKTCGLIDDDGVESVVATFKSGRDAGQNDPHPPLESPLSKIKDQSQSDQIIVKWAGSSDWPDANWLVEDLIPDNAVGLIVGESQAGKSFVCMNLAGSIACGKPFFTKRIIEKGGTIYVGAEGQFSIRERLEAEFAGSIKSYLEEKDTSDQTVLSDMPIAVIDNVPDLAESDEVKRLLKSISDVSNEMQERFKVPLKLIIVDTMIAAIGLDDWNSAGQAQKAMNVLKEISRATGAVTIGVHHHGKDKSRGAVGSFAFTASSDFIISVHRTADEFGRVKSRQLALTKSRSGETGWSCSFNLKLAVVAQDQFGKMKTCAYVEPDLDTVAFTNANVTSKLKANKVLSIFNSAFESALESDGQSIEFSDGTFRCVSKRMLRQKFDSLHEGKTNEASRRAFDRALLKAIGERAVMSKKKNGEEFICESTPILNETCSATAALFDD